MSMIALIMLSALCTQARLAGQPPKLIPRVVLPGEAPGGAFWLSARYIVIVKVNAVEWIGPEVEVTPHVLVVQMVRVEADLENVIQGELPRGPTRFYFFANKLTDNGYHTFLSWLEPDGRYVVFLREDGGVLRTMADVAGLNIPIRSGRHDQIGLAPSVLGEHYPGKEIAYAALTPSSAYGPGFAAGLVSEYGALDGLAPRGYILQLLRNLLNHPDESIREWACLALSVNYNYLDPCSLKLSKSKDSAVRALASGFVGTGATGERRVIKVLSDDPYSLSGRVEDLDGALEAFTYDSDAGVRHQACATLRRLFPSRDFANCTPSAASKR